MTPERAQSIRDHWAANRDRAMEPLRDTRVFRVAVRQKFEPQDFASAEVADPNAAIPVYEYRLEHGYQDDRPMTRVVCEGVQVEIGPRPRWASRS